MTTAARKAPAKTGTATPQPTLAKQAPVARKAAARQPGVPAPAAAKPAAAAATTTVAAAAKLERPSKTKKPKLVRDSFTIPKVEYGVLEDLKQRSHKLMQPAKKSELLRAGIKALAAMSDSALLAALKAVPAIKTGRPAKD